MPLDTRQKRQSAVSLLVPMFPPGVVPSGAMGLAERQASVWMYSGIMAGLLLQYLAIYAQVSLGPWVAVTTESLTPWVTLEGVALEDLSP